MVSGGRAASLNRHVHTHFVDESSVNAHRFFHHCPRIQPLFLRRCLLEFVAARVCSEK